MGKRRCLRAIFTTELVKNWIIREPKISAKRINHYPRSRIGCHGNSIEEDSVTIDLNVNVNLERRVIQPSNIIPALNRPPFVLQHLYKHVGVPGARGLG